MCRFAATELFPRAAVYRSRAALVACPDKLNINSHGSAVMKLITPVFAFTTLFATGAFAQIVPPTNTPGTVPPPTTTIEKNMPTAPSTTMTPPSVTAPSFSSTSLSLTDAQVKAWVDKTVYSSDGKNLGEVAAFARDASGKVTEMHADMGGFLGMGETRVRLMPSDFRLGESSVTLTMTAEQAKTLPKIAK
jgi:PRC-barrel domain